jgi:glycosyltransferase involved in cell wall biosynthesis
MIHKDYPDAKLTIIGDGEERKKLEAEIRLLELDEFVFLPGFVDNPYDYYAQADVFVQTSLWEGFGYVLAEAMACGTPVVAYDAHGAMREILDGGEYGILVPPGNLGALKVAIVSQIEHPTRKEILLRGVDRFNKDKIVNEYLEVFVASRQGGSVLVNE